jgi:hypothetical protein
MNHMINFSKNLALAGGALALLGVDEPWEASLTNITNQNWERKSARLDAS